jgi:hypothetical protein
MTSTVLILGGLGLAVLWLGLYLIDEEIERTLERAQLQRWTRHLGKPLQKP